MISKAMLATAVVDLLLIAANVAIEQLALSFYGDVTTTVVDLPLIAANVAIGQL